MPTRPAIGRSITRVVNDTCLWIDRLPAHPMIYPVAARHWWPKRIRPALSEWSPTLNTRSFRGSIPSKAG